MAAPAAPGRTPGPVVSNALFKLRTESKPSPLLGSATWLVGLKLPGLAIVSCPRRIPLWFWPEVGLAPGLATIISAIWEADVAGTTTSSALGETNVLAS